jgi:hypothetical protein
MLCALAFGAAFGYAAYEHYRSDNDASYEGFLFSGANSKCGDPNKFFLLNAFKQFDGWYENAGFMGKALTYPVRYITWSTSLATQIYTTGKGNKWALFGGIAVILLMLFCIIRPFLPLLALI